MSTITTPNTNSANFLTQVRSAGEGPGKAPYIDARELAGKSLQTMQCLHIQITPDTTLDDAGVAIDPTADLLINCGFEPLVAIVHDEVNSHTDIKWKGQPGLYAQVFTAAANAETDTRMSFGSGATIDQLTIDASMLTTLELLDITVFGRPIA